MQSFWAGLAEVTTHQWALHTEPAFFLTISAASASEASLGKVVFGACGAAARDILSLEERKDLPYWCLGWPIWSDSVTQSLFLNFLLIMKYGGHNWQAGACNMGWISWMQNDMLLPHPPFAPAILCFVVTQHPNRAFLHCSFCMPLFFLDSEKWWGEGNRNQTFFFFSLKASVSK